MALQVRSIKSELDLLPNQRDLEYIALLCEDVRDRLQKVLDPERKKVSIVIGGSYAKGTLVRKETYDIDLFVRFKQENNPADRLGRALKKAFGASPFAIQRVHGSRDYFQLTKEKRFVIEIIPVLWINSPSQAVNVMDLSIFHVRYMKRHLTPKLQREVVFSKAFCQGCGTYGAESYIGGFSGYALECLILNYRTFERLLLKLFKVQSQLVLDPARHFHNKQEIFLNLNESRLQSPIVLVDPTYKERNVLAALQVSSLKRFQDAAKAFLSGPSETFFLMHEVKLSELLNKAKRKRAELVRIILWTEKQGGDIAATKLKRASRAIDLEILPYAFILDEHFKYSGGGKGEAYFILKMKKELLIRGPPIHMEKHVKIFRKKHRNTFIKSGRLYAKKKISPNVESTIKSLLIARKDKLRSMEITKSSVEEIGENNLN